MQEQVDRLMSGTPLGTGTSATQRLNSIPRVCQRTDIGRTKIYQAMHPDPAYRRGMPHLRSVTVGGRRLVPEEALNDFITALEAQAVT